MPIDLIWRPQAREDLLDIYVVIGVDDPAAADRVCDSIDARARQLIDHPRLGPRRSDIRQSLRMLVEGPYLLLYETQPDSDIGTIERVEIVRVIDGRRMLTTLS